MDFMDLQRAAIEKLRREGYGAMLVYSIPTPAFSLKPKKNYNYGVAYGAALFPLSVQSYIEQAYKEKERLEFVDWLASHGGKINFSFLDTEESYTKKWVEEHQAMAKKAGVYLVPENADLLLGLTVNPKNDPLLRMEAFPDMYERFGVVLQKYLNDEWSLVL